MFEQVLAQKKIVDNQIKKIEHRIKQAPHGSLNVKGKYLYMSYREDGCVKNKYYGVVNDEKIDSLKRSNEKYKTLKLELYRLKKTKNVLNKMLKAGGYKGE